MSHNPMLDNHILQILQDQGVDIHPQLVAEIRNIYAVTGATMPACIANRLPNYDDDCDPVRLLHAIGIECASREA